MKVSVQPARFRRVSGGRHAPDEWALTGDDRLSTLAHRQLPQCALELQPGGWGVGGPVVSDNASFAGLTWRTTYWLVDGWLTYWPQRAGSICGLRCEWIVRRRQRRRGRVELPPRAVLRTLSFTSVTAAGVSDGFPPVVR